MKPDGTCGVIRYNSATNRYFKCRSRPLNGDEYCGRCTLYLEELEKDRKLNGL